MFFFLFFFFFSFAFQLLALRAVWNKEIRNIFKDVASYQESELGFTKRTTCLKKRKSAVNPFRKFITHNIVTEDSDFVRENDSVPFQRYKKSVTQLSLFIYLFFFLNYFKKILLKKLITN